MEGGGCTEWIYIDACGWRVIASESDPISLDTELA